MPPDEPPIHPPRYDGPSATTSEEIKALTHPLRRRILSLFDAEPELTATRCAELTGESVASCSFHLRQLGRYGFVVRGEARGKERPWRSAGGYSVVPHLDQPGALDAARAHGRLYLTGELQRLLDWMAAAGDEDHEWLYASTQSSATFWATRAELYELAREIESLTDRFAGRTTDPSKRPQGSRRCRFFGAANAELPPVTADGRPPAGAETSEERS